MNYAEIKYCDIANGLGVRVSLFVSGCTHKCKNCFNKVAWDFNYGKPFTDEVQKEIFKNCEPDYIAGITVLGGEPFEPENQPEILQFLEKFKEKFPQKDIWCFSGYTYEQLTGQESSRCFTDNTQKMLDMIDVLVDGEYVDELRSLMLKFKGSSNQRVIDLNKTRETGQITLLDI